jgi:hypothetical protein
MLPHNACWHASFKAVIEPYSTLAALERMWPMSRSKKGLLDGLKVRIKEVVDIAENCPEPYRQKCFEVLLKSLVSAEISVGEGTGQTQVSLKAKEVDRARTRRLSLGELKGDFGPKSGTEYVVMCGHWLEQYEQKAEGFSRSDIKECFRQLRCHFRNPSDFVAKALTQGLLIEDKRKLLLSQTGIDLVASRLGGTDND